MSASTMLWWLLVGHAVADFWAQSDAVAQMKNRNRPNTRIPPGQKPQTVWPYAMTAHAMMHGAAVAFVTGNVWLGIAETVGALAHRLRQVRELVWDSRRPVHARHLQARVACGGVRMTTQDQDDAREAARSVCGNPRHPDGAWHPATSLPFYGTLRGWVEERRQAARRAAWGCGCRSRRPAFEKDVARIVALEIAGIALALGLLVLGIIWWLT